MKKIREHVRGELPCCHGRAVVVDHLPMAMKEGRKEGRKEGWMDGWMDG